VLAACGSGDSGDRTDSGTRAAGGGDPARAVKAAIAVLNRWDLPAYCRLFAPGGHRVAPQLQGAANCDDPQLLGLMTRCTGCERDIQIETTGTDVTGDAAVVHVKVRGFRGAAQVTTKDVRLVRRDGKWLLVTNPDATLP
jgi:hypothetical protein